MDFDHLLSKETDKQAVIRRLLPMLPAITAWHGVQQFLRAPLLRNVAVSKRRESVPLEPPTAPSEHLLLRPIVKWVRWAGRVARVKVEKLIYKFALETAGRDHLGNRFIYRSRVLLEKLIVGQLL
jgi:hypothetical protein